MDFVEILVLLAFILFPMLQALLEKLGGARRTEIPPEWEVEQEGSEAPVGTLERPETKLEDPDSGWSDGWGEWPGMAPEDAGALEELSAQPVVTAEEAEEILHERRRIPQERVSEAARVTAPVVSLERVDLPRVREGRSTRPLAAAPPRRARRRRDNLFAHILHDDAELRRSVLLAEILGPPRSLREADLDP